MKRLLVRIVRIVRIPRSSLLALAAVLGCGDTTNTPRNQLTFDRPIDMAFACYGSLQLNDGTEKPVSSPMPTVACDKRAEPRENEALPLNAWPGQEGIGNDAVAWYGLVLESGPGTVNLMQFKIAFPATQFEGAVVDADPLTPGVNGISVGEEPVAIITDPAGCHAITANAGSCDLSVLDLNSALPPPKRGARVDRLEVTNAAGAPLRARPAAMVGMPSSEDIGNMCPANPTGLVYIAYPSCHLVAGIDTATGKVVTGVQFDAAGVPSLVVGGNVTCPAECDGGGAVTAGIRPVALDLQRDPKSGAKRLVIGADNSASISIVKLDDAYRPQSVAQVALENKTGTLGISALAVSPEIGMGGGTTGVLDPIDDEAAGQTHQFVYAVASDRTVRVADVYDIPKECDTQVDPRFARNVTDVVALSCFPVGAPTTPSRRPSARGPGIQLPGSAVPLAVDFVRVDRLPLPPQQEADPKPDVPEFRNPDLPGTLIGDFALISTSNGGIFVANVDDDDYPDLFKPATPLAVSMTSAMAHQLRDLDGQRSLTIDDEDEQNIDTGGDATIDDHSSDDKTCVYGGKINGTIGVGRPRISAPPERKVQAGTVAPEKLATLPGLRQLLCNRRARHASTATDDIQSADYDAVPELAYAVPDPDPTVAPPGTYRDRAFPDLMALPESETWNLVWEGSLSLNTGTSSVNGPQVRENMMKADALGLHVLDESKSLCDTGVEPFDTVQLRGCDPSFGSADCAAGYTCFVHPESQLQGRGACMLSNEADRLANACKDFLTSERHYTVTQTASGELVAIARRRALSTTPLDGCVDNNQCTVLADQAMRLTSSKQPFEDSMVQDPHTWSCVADPLRAPMGGTGKRCEMTCNPPDLQDPQKPPECLTGTVCQGAVPGQPKSGFCMEGVIPPQACINAAQRYELHAGEAFAVIGSRSGFVHPIIADATGKCVRDPAASRLSIGRLPLVPRDPLSPTTPQACGDPATTDQLTGALAGGGFEPNPCTTTVSHTEAVPVYRPGTCSQDTQVIDNKTVNKFRIAERQGGAPAVRFRNRGMTFTIVDPYYPGDTTCISDRQANLGQIPRVVPGYTITFHQIGGFSPMQVLGLPASEDRPSFPVKLVRGPANTVWAVDEGDFLSASATSASTRGKVLRLEPLTPGQGTALK